MSADGEPKGLEVLRQTHQVHCARGTARCARCQELYAHGPTWELVVPDANPMGAARMVVQFPDGAWSPYRVAKVFASRAEAEAYGRAHGLPLQGAE